MSVFYCSGCDTLVDSDYTPNFSYNEKTREWKCESCIDNEEDESE